jgi:hypothetical protein
LAYPCWYNPPMNLSDTTGGTLAVQPTHRQVLKEACVRMDGLGDFHQVLIILERAWSERDARVEVETHWRSIMDEFGWTFLFN